MAVTSTTRFGITRWSDGGDSFTRVQMDGSHASIETLGVIYEEGLESELPVPGLNGRFYYATDTDTLSYDNGAAWQTVTPAVALEGGTLGDLNITGTLTAETGAMFTGPGAVTVCTSGTRPGTPTEGQVIYETDTNSYWGWRGSMWLPIGGGATGGGTDDVFYENSQTVSTSYEITAGKNAGSFGPITIAGGVTVTVPASSVWTVV